MKRLSGHGRFGCSLSCVSPRIQEEFKTCGILSNGACGGTSISTGLKRVGYIKNLIGGGNSSPGLKSGGFFAEKTMKKLLLVFLLIPTISQAAKDDLKQAEKLFDQMQYNLALVSAVQILEDPNNDPAQLVEAYSLQGLCLAALDRSEEATMAFRRVLAINPDFQLSRDTSPKLSPPFSKALATEQKPISLMHTPPEVLYTLSKAGLWVVLQSDSLDMVSAIRLIFWEEGSKDRVSEVGLIGPGKVTLKLLLEPKDGRVLYYFEAINRFGGVLSRLGNKKEPFEVRVEVGQPPVLLSQVSGGVPPLTLVSGQPYSDTNKEVPGRPFYKTWWFWTAVGVAVVGGIATGIAVPLAGKHGSGDAYNSYAIGVK